MASHLLGFSQEALHPWALIVRIQRDHVLLHTIGTRDKGTTSGFEEFVQIVDKNIFKPTYDGTETTIQRMRPEMQRQTQTKGRAETKARVVQKMLIQLWCRFLQIPVDAFENVFKLRHRERNRIPGQHCLTHVTIE